MCIELPETYEAFSGAVGKLKKDMDGMVQADRCRYNKLNNDLKPSHAEPCSFHRIVDRKL